ncbi:MAG: transcriptional regulator [Hyphomicrobiales bacterium]|nr:transcriptional regulator [Hyphomicrobiales bacterium]
MTLGLLPNFLNTMALRYFYEVARYGSFRLTAEKIHIAASAISRQIQLLEEELGVKLFVRDRKSLRLTAAGEALLYRVKRIMSELSTARSEIDALLGDLRGNIRLGINDTVAREFLPSFLNRFRKSHPHITFEFTVANSDELADILVRDEVDIIIGYAMQARARMQQIVSFDLKTCVTLRKDHALSQRSSVRVADLVGETIIMPINDSMLREILDTIFARVSVKPVSVITTNSFELMATLVADGHGIGCQVRLHPGADPVRPEIIYVPISNLDMRSAVLACCISDQGTPTTAVSICLDVLRETLALWHAETVSKA